MRTMLRCLMIGLAMMAISASPVHATSWVGKMKCLQYSDGTKFSYTVTINEDFSCSGCPSGSCIHANGLCGFEPQCGFARTYSKGRRVRSLDVFHGESGTANACSTIFEAKLRNASSGSAKVTLTNWSNLGTGYICKGTLKQP
jgi:hypothetical protein